MVKELDYDIAINEFELQSRYYVYFRTNTLGKGMNALSPLAKSYIVTSCSFKKVALASNYSEVLICH